MKRDSFAATDMTVQTSVEMKKGKEEDLDKRTTEETADGHKINGRKQIETHHDFPNGSNHLLNAFPGESTLKSDCSQKRNRNSFL